MKQSIEAIWKNGFLEDKALLAPKLNELYSQKSRTVVGKFEQLFAININVILIAMVAVAVVLSSFGFFWLAIYVDFLLAMLVIFAKQTRKHLIIDNSMSSYQYLLTFYGWLHGQIDRFSKVYRLFYPLLALGLMVQYRFSETGQLMINYLNQQNEADMILFGLPVLWLLLSLSLLFVLWLSAPAIYRWEMKLVYGKELDKLKQLVQEMKLLSDTQLAGE